MQKQQKHVTVQRLVNEFGFEIRFQGNIKNKIFLPNLNRTGIELASGKVFDAIYNVVLWSGNENKYLQSLKPKDRERAIANVFKLNPPAIIATHAFKFQNEILKIAKLHSTPVLYTNYSSAQLYPTVAFWLTRQLADYKTLHGTLVSVFGCGVLLKGPSGIGKSEIAMELIKKGHIFVCDDATDVTNIGGRLFGRPNAVSNKFIEVRGMGILSVSKMFGIEKTQPSCDIDIVINFVKDSDYVSKPFERIGKQLNFETIESVKVASYNLPVTPGRKMSDLVETVVVDFKLKQEGYYSAKEYIEQFKKVNQKI